MFFNLSNKDSLEVNNMLEFFNKSDDEGCEFEIRFKDANSTFFFNLYAELKKIAEPLVTNTTVSITNSGRYTLEPSGEFSVMTKENLFKYDVLDFNIRLSLAMEVIRGNVKEIPDLVNITRNKSRSSFIFSKFRVDLTIVSNTYEIELEMLKGAEYKDVIDMTFFILKIKQNNFIIIDAYEKDAVLKRYKHLVGSNRFVGAQPESLHGHHLPELYKKSYSVTRKIDGERCLLLLDNKGKVYGIDSNLNNVYKTDMVSKTDIMCILDTERVNEKDSVTFYCFDVLVYNGADIRGDVKETLKERLEIVKGIVNNVQDTIYYKLRVKEFFLKNIFVASKILMSQKSAIDDDGLIFTPINEPYPVSSKSPSLLKWKAPSLNTIDFFSHKLEDGSWELYVTSPDTVKPESKSEIEPLKMLFDVESITGMACEVKTFTTTFDDNIDKTSGMEFQSGTVIEYMFDCKLQKFIPLRTRWDKTANPWKHGNFVYVALDIWKNILNPVKLESIYKLSSYDNNSYFKSMRYIHNRIKEKMYKDYIKPDTSLLELACGKGGDTMKWSGVKYVHGYDIDTASISECIKRNKGNLQNKFWNLDLSTKDASDVISLNNNTQQFSNVACQFAIHYFLQSKETMDNFVNILDDNLQTGGKFMTTFMDSEKVLELLNGNKYVYKSVDNEIVYYMETAENGNDGFGNSIQVYLNGNNVLSQGSLEYLVNFEFLVKFMSSRGYKVVSSRPFSDSWKDTETMKEYECDIFNLNRYVIFEKTDSVNLSLKSLEIEIEKVKVVQKTFDDKIQSVKVTDKSSIVNHLHTLGDTVPLESGRVKGKEDIESVFKNSKLNLKFIDWKNPKIPEEELKDDTVYIYEKHNKKSIGYHILTKV